MDIACLYYQVRYQSSVDSVWYPCRHCYLGSRLRGSHSRRWSAKSRMILAIGFSNKNFLSHTILEPCCPRFHRTRKKRSTISTTHSAMSPTQIPLNLNFSFPYIYIFHLSHFSHYSLTISSEFLELSLSRKSLEFFKSSYLTMTNAKIITVA